MENNTKVKVLFTKSQFPQGKVRDLFMATGVKHPEQQYMSVTTTDRISAYDVILPVTIPGKGQILNEIAEFFLKETASLVPNWYIASPLPQNTMGKYAKPFDFEVVLREYIAGSMYKAYKKGQREFWGIVLPEGLREYDKLPQLMFTPTTKAKVGHDESITREEIIELGIATADEYLYICEAAAKVFNAGQKIANDRGLILVDTKYEFGKANDGRILLIDEVNTPDSSRYIYLEGYEDNLAAGTPQKELSKEPARRWLKDNGFEGKEGQTMPELTDEFVETVTNGYEELYRIILGKDFVRKELPANADEILDEALNQLFEN